MHLAGKKRDHNGATASVCDQPSVGGVQHQAGDFLMSVSTPHVNTDEQPQGGAVEGTGQELLLCYKISRQSFPLGQWEQSQIIFAANH